MQMLTYSIIIIIIIIIFFFGQKSISSRVS